MKDRRSRFDIFYDICKSLRYTNITISKLVYKANLSYDRMKESVHILSICELIDIQDDKTCSLTEKGKDFLFHYGICRRFFEK